MIRPSAPAATLAMERGFTRREVPEAWLGSTITGRCVRLLSTGTAEMSSVLRVLVSKVRMPRSQRITCSFPPDMMYSALISSSWMVFARPRLSRMGFFSEPSSLSSSKFCMFRAPTWITSTSSKSGMCAASMISVTMGRPVSFLAMDSSRSPSSCRPWKA